jgi:hypothetical protein
MNIKYAEVIDALREAVPETGPIVDHRVEEDGEVLPHLIFDDLSRLVVAANAGGDDDLVARCVSFLETLLREGDNTVVNLVQVSFVENIGPWDDETGRFIEMWPPLLLKEAERQRDWKPGDPGPFSIWYRP